MSRHGHDSPAALPAVTPEQLATIATGYDAWNRGGPEAMAREVWAPEIVWHDPPDFPDATVRRGAREVRRHLEQRIDSMGPVPVTVEGAWRAGDDVTALIELRIRTEGPASGVALDASIYHLIRYAGDRAVEVWEFTRRDDALRAAASRAAVGGGATASTPPRG